MKEPPLALNELVAALALSAVEVQRTLDQDRWATLRRFSDSDAALLQALGLGPLLAPALLVTEFRVGSQVSISVDRQTDFTIAARPINLSFRLSHGSQEATESRLELTVSRVPLPHPRLPPPAFESDSQPLPPASAAGPENKGASSQ